MGELSEWYRGQSILLTGATGYLGRAVTEKLLRTCKLQRLYLLMRPKKGINIEKRMDELFQDPVFDEVKATIPEYKDIITILNGDICLVDLGLSEGDREFLSQEITVLVHCAASIKLVDSIKNSANINVRGTKNVMEFCLKLTQLKAVVHVSTLFSCFPYEEIYEKFYSSPISGEELIQQIDCLNEYKLEDTMKSMISPWPNVYTFMKYVAEDIVRTYGHRLPIAIFRPSVVFSAAEEPIQGWSDKNQGIVIIIIGLSHGIIKVLRGNNDSVCGIVPVDMCANLILASAKYASKQKSTTIFNFFSSPQNKLLWGKFVIFLISKILKYPTRQAISYSSLKLLNNNVLFKIYDCIFHLLPAIILDLLYFLTRKKLRAVRNYKRIHTLMKSLSPFLTKRFTVYDENTSKLFAELTEEDKKTYNFNLQSIEWESYTDNAMHGIRKYIFLENDDTIQEARRRMFWLKIMNLIILSLPFALISWFIWMYQRKIT